MRRTFSVPFTLSLALLLAALPTALAQEEPPPEIEGTVVKVQQRVRTENGAEFTELQIRTREQQMMQLRLGETGSCVDCVREGDQVRARLMGGDAQGEPQRVRSMKVRRTGQSLDFRSESGDLVQTRDQQRLRSRDRIHEPGTGGGSGEGRRGSGGGAGGGGGRRGGGRR